MGPKKTSYTTFIYSFDGLAGAPASMFMHIVSKTCCRLCRLQGYCIQQIAVLRIVLLFFLVRIVVHSGHLCL